MSFSLFYSLISICFMSFEKIQILVDPFNKNHNFGIFKIILIIMCPILLVVSALPVFFYKV